MPPPFPAPANGGHSARNQADTAAVALAALRLDPSTIACLNTLGFETIRDLMDQPRAPPCASAEIGRRSTRLSAIWRSQSIDPRSRAVGCAASMVSRSARPTTIARTGKLVAALCVELEKRGLGARRLDLLFLGSTVRCKPSVSARRSLCATSNA